MALTFCAKYFLSSRLPVLYAPYLLNFIGFQILIPKICCRSFSVVVTRLWKSLNVSLCFTGFASLEAAKHVAAFLHHLVIPYFLAHVFSLSIPHNPCPFYLLVVEGPGCSFWVPVCFVNDERVKSWNCCGRADHINEQAAGEIHFQTVLETSSFGQPVLADLLFSLKHNSGCRFYSTECANSMCFFSPEIKYLLKWASVTAVFC